MIAILACWLLFAATYIGFAEPGHRLIATARWSAAALLDAIGLGHWTWPVGTSAGEQPWPSGFVRGDVWHLSQVEAVLAAFWTATAWAVGLTLLGLSLTLAWWLGKRRAITRYERQAAVQHLAAVDDDNRPGLPARAEERPVALPDHQKQDQPAEQEEVPDIEGLFRQGQVMEAWEETRPRKPVARHEWRYRPCQHF